MLTTIINKLTGKITIDITPEMFIFSWRGRSISIETFLYLFNENEKYKILGIGENFEGSDTCHRIDLFSGPPPKNNTISRSELLEAFLRFGFRKITDRVLIQPTIIFRGTYSINEILAGYQKTVLRDAAFKAGAYAVEIEN